MKLLTTTWRCLRGETLAITIEGEGEPLLAVVAHGKRWWLIHPGTYTVKVLSGGRSISGDVRFVPAITDVDGHPLQTCNILGTNLKSVHVVDVNRTRLVRNVLEFLRDTSASPSFHEYASQTISELHKVGIDLSELRTIERSL